MHAQQLRASAGFVRDSGNSRARVSRPYFVGRLRCLHGKGTTRTRSRAFGTAAGKAGGARLSRARCVLSWHDRVGVLAARMPMGTRQGVGARFARTQSIKSWTCCNDGGCVCVGWPRFHLAWISTRQLQKARRRRAPCRRAPTHARALASPATGPPTASVVQRHPATVHDT